MFGSASVNARLLAGACTMRAKLAGNIRYLLSYLVATSRIDVYHALDLELVWLLVLVFHVR